MTDFLAADGDVGVAEFAGASLCADDDVVVAVDVWAGPGPLALESASKSVGDAYWQSLSDLVHVAHLGLCSSHLTLRRRHVRLGHEG